MLKSLFLFGIVLTVSGIQGNLAQAWQTVEMPIAPCYFQRGPVVIQSEGKDSFERCLLHFRNAATIDQYPQLNAETSSENPDNKRYLGWRCLGIQKVNKTYQELKVFGLTTGLNAFSYFPNTKKGEIHSFDMSLNLSDSKGLAGMSKDGLQMQLKSFPESQFTSDKQPLLVRFVLTDSSDKVKAVGSCVAEIKTHNTATKYE